MPKIPAYDFEKMIADQESDGFMVTGFKMNSMTMKRLKEWLKGAGILIADPLDSPIERIQGIQIKLDEDLEDYQIAIEKTRWNPVWEADRLWMSAIHRGSLPGAFYTKGN